GRPSLRVRGATPPVQVVHVDDLVDALLLAIADDLPGTYNVAADGWLGADDARALLPRSLLPPMPAELLERALARLWASGLGAAPPPAPPRLLPRGAAPPPAPGAAGRPPRHSNEDAMVEGLDSLPPPSRAIRYVACAVLAAMLGTAVGVLIRRRRHR